MAIKGHGNVVTRVGNFFKKRGGEAAVSEVYSWMVRREESFGGLFLDGK